MVMVMGARLQWLPGVLPVLVKLAGGCPPGCLAARPAAVFLLVMRTLVA